MFTAPAPSAPTISTTTSQASPSSPTRPSRLRGLSYLRNYTHNHIHHTGPSRPALGRTRSSPSTRDDSPTGVNSDTTPSQAVGTHTNTQDTMPSIRKGSRGTSRQQSGSDAPSAGVTGTTRMTRSRADSASANVSLRNASSSANMNGNGQTEKQREEARNLPSIRFIPHVDPRAPRPSLSFSSISRTLPDESAIIRVGRYSERDNAPDAHSNVPSSASVGFKSKVVSRRHCEFWYSDNRWFIKDVKSSSGTFLNHIRLSQPGVESKPYEVKDGDVVQLGIDFRGGEEMIFRCVKIRIECNRGWQQGLNSFNKLTHKRLRNLAKTTSKKETASDAASTHTSECSICLMSIAPCQSLFVAPCSHVWHYKCIRPILQGPTAPTFLCPNCRAVTDLEADVDEPNGFSDSDDSEVEAAMHEQHNAEATPPDSGTPEVTPRAVTSLLAAGTSESNPSRLSARSENTQADPDDRVLDGDALEDAMAGVVLTDSLQTSASEDTDSAADPSPNAVAQPVPISTSVANNRARTLSPDGAVHDADFPMTPRNDVGPFVLDGSAGRTNNPRRMSDVNGDDQESPSRPST